VSYGACLPYNIEAPERRIDGLEVSAAEKFRSQRDIDVRTRHEALGIDTKRQVVHARKLDGNRTYELGYDPLVIATGAAAAQLPLPGVFLLRELDDGATIKLFLAERMPSQGINIGAGYIGMEMAESLRHRGLEVVVLERVSQVVPGFEPEIARLVQDELKRNAVRVETSLAVTESNATRSGS